MQFLYISPNLENIGSYWDKVWATAAEWTPKIAMAIISTLLIYLIGSWLIKVVMKYTAKVFEKRHLDVSLSKFLMSMMRWVLNILLFILIITQLGVQTSVFVAIIGAAGLAIGLALQGSLANFAGSVLILTLKPFKVGDYIAGSNGEAGTVVDIDIFATKLKTPQNQIVIVPNGALSNSRITNYSQLDDRRTWFDIRISYDANLELAKQTLLDVLNNNEMAFKDPAPQIVITELGEYAVNFSVRVTTSNGQFWTMREKLIVDCKEALEKANIAIAYPQRDIHIKQPA